MTGGQVLTLLTFLIAAAIFGCGAVVAYKIDWNDEFFSWFSTFGRTIGDNSRTFTAWTTLFLSFGAAIALVQAQQGITGWLVKRELQRIRETFREVELALGTAAAEQFLAYKAERVQASSNNRRIFSGIFG